MTPKVLIVDDEPSILHLISAYLKPEGFEILTATNGKMGLQAILTEKPDIVILDIMLPEMDGVEVLTRARKESNVWAIMLTAKTEETDKIIGLTVGADDYVTKPFSPKELVARVKSAIRRVSNDKEVEKSLSFGELVIDPVSRRVMVSGEEIELTTIEFNLLLSLAQNAGRVLSRERLLEIVWGTNYYGEIRVVDVHIGHVRHKIGEKFITTVRGVGFRFEP